MEKYRWVDLSDGGFRIHGLNIKMTYEKWHPDYMARQRKISYGSDVERKWEKALINEKADEGNLDEWEREREKN